MNTILKRFTAILLIFVFGSLPVLASDLVKTRVKIENKFSINDVPEEVSFMVSEEIVFPNGIKIPANSTLNLKVYQYQKERRWHKSGFFISKPVSYSIDGNNLEYISGDDIYLVARRHEDVNKKEATVLTFELIVMTGASIFVPGVDIGYFFIKGAIQRKNHQNWFKSGVASAYENSICWFWLKGKPIELNEDDLVNVKQIKKRKAEKLKLKIDKRHIKENLKNDMKNIKQEKKEIKRQQKAARRKSIEIAEPVIYR